MTLLFIPIIYINILFLLTKPLPVIKPISFLIESLIYVSFYDVMLKNTIKC